MRSPLFAVAFAAAAALCCSGNNSLTNANDLGAVQCHWPSTLDDAGPGACHAARALVACHDSSGNTCSCLSDDAMTCSACGAGDSGCQDQCGANQYAVSCGSIGPSGPSPGGIADPPQGCTTKGPTPAGIIQYCCPCQ